MRLTDEYWMTCPCGREIVLAKPAAFVCECGLPCEVTWGAPVLTIPAQQTGNRPSVKLDRA